MSEQAFTRWKDLGLDLTLFTWFLRLTGHLVHMPGTDSLIGQTTSRYPSSSAKFAEEMLSTSYLFLMNKATESEFKCLRCMQT